MKSVVLVGAGGHAKVAYDIFQACDVKINGFLDPNVAAFYDLEKHEEFDIDFGRQHLVTGVGGVNPEKLSKRCELYKRYLKLGALYLGVISPSACISASASLGHGVFISHNVVINSSSKISDFAIINTGAIIEHDVTIEEGSHIAPGAIVLGGAHIGKNCMIGAGAVVLVGAVVGDNSILPSLKRYKN